MSLERMLVSGATRAVGADAARLFTRKDSKASASFILVIAIASAIYGWLFLMRKRSKWWQRLLGVPLMIGGNVFLTMLAALPQTEIPDAQRQFGYLLLVPAITFVIGLIATMVSNARYRTELETAKAEAEIIAANDAFLTENGLSSMDNWDLFHDETGLHFKRISDMPGGVLYSIVGRRGRRAKLSLQDGKFLSFDVLDATPSKLVGLDPPDEDPEE
jgi:hypothetical protein